MSGHIENDDSRLLPAALEVLDNVLHPSICRGLIDPGIQVETFFEIDIDDMVATEDPVERHSATVNVDSLEHGDLFRSRQNVVCDVLKVFKLVRHELQCPGNLRTRHDNLIPPIQLKNVSSSGIHRREKAFSTCSSTNAVCPLNSIQKSRIMPKTRPTLAIRKPERSVPLLERGWTGRTA